MELCTIDIQTPPLVILLAGLSGSGKSTFAPCLAKALNATLLDSDDLFVVPRTVVGSALGIGPKIVDEPQWRGVVHGRLLSFFLALASTAATPEHPVVAVSPWTGFRQLRSKAFDEARSGLTSEFRWVIATCPSEIRYERICSRGREMDATKIATGPTPDPDLDVPAGAVFVDLGCGLDLYPSIARDVEQALKVQSGAVV
jgi:energy-coupling factor transporter ATP-binding protein EcfA2